MLVKSVAILSASSHVRHMQLFLAAVDNEDHARELTEQVVENKSYIYTYPLQNYRERMYHIVSIPADMPFERIFEPTPGSKTWIGVHNYKNSLGEYTDIILMLGPSTNTQALQMLSKVRLGTESSFVVYPIKLGRITPLYLMRQDKHM